MLHDTPLRNRHRRFVETAFRRAADQEAAGVVQRERPGAAQGRIAPVPDIEYLAYGPADESGLPCCELVSTFGPLEAEYAAIRRGTGILDSPHRGTLRVLGGDRREFLNRMLTQDLHRLEAGQAAESFWLNRKGRVEADLLVIELGDEMLVDVDIHRAAHTVETLKAFVFAEDVEISDVSTSMHRLALHGREAIAFLAAIAGEGAALDPLRAARLNVAGATVAVARRDQAGEPGLEILLDRAEAEPVWDALLSQVDLLGGGQPRARPIGWQAFNIARIEAGTPLFNIDFDSTALPHETGLLGARVSFTKGCYLGQEVVARMQSLGKPKQVVVGLRMVKDALPMAGAQVFASEEGGAVGQQVGLVTSSTLSPMLGAAAIAFATVRTAFAEPGRELLVAAEGEMATARTGPLRFWPRPEESTP